MKQIILTNKQAELLREYLICTKSYRLGEIAYYKRRNDKRRAEPYQQMENIADEIIPLLQNSMNM